MKKLRRVRANSITLEEGCNKYLDNCRARNLREGTINHYRQSYVQFAKFFDMQMKVSDITEEVYQKYVVYLRQTLHNDVNILILSSKIYGLYLLLNNNQLCFFFMFRWCLLTFTILFHCSRLNYFIFIQILRSFFGQFR